jgi:N-methylhydantoinase A
MSSGGAVPVEQAALGVLRVAVANMERALRVVSIERGFDPRKAALLAFGGAGGLHACDIAESLEMTRVVVPPLPGAFSAFGVLAGDVVRDFSRTFLRTLPLSPADRGEVEALFADLEGEARSALRDEGVRDTDASVRRTVGLRYRGQSFDLDVEWSDDSAPEFHRAHRSRYGHADEARQVELVHLRVRACGRVPEPPLPSLSRREGEAVARDVAEVHFAGGWRVIPVYVREGLQAGEYAQGPALVKEYGSTTLVNPGWKFVVDEFGCLRLSR